MGHVERLVNQVKSAQVGHANSPAKLDSPTALATASIHSQTVLTVVLVERFARPVRFVLAALVHSHVKARTPTVLVVV